VRVFSGFRRWFDEHKNQYGSRMVIRIYEREREKTDAPSGASA
jgi:hypothetical protein